MHDNIYKAVELFSSFPGIGPRQAKRFVYFLLSRSNTYVNELLEVIRELRNDMVNCSSCFRLVQKQTTKENTCAICHNPNTDLSTIMVVEKDVDLEALAKAGSHSGGYFIMGGLIPVLDRNPSRRIRIKELKKRLGEIKELKEVILAFAVNAQADHTMEYIRAELKPLASKGNFSISILGRGLSTGAELEYADPSTLLHALQNRG